MKSSRFNPWLMLLLGVMAQATGSVFISTPAFLIPLLHSKASMSLATAGLLAGAPTLGMVLALVAWGAAADRYGERWVIAGGMALTGLASAGAAATRGYVGIGIFLLLGGMAAASTSAASGRVVVGWFPKDRRGIAMGIRQMSQPLGVTVAALTIPRLAGDHGIGGAMLLPAGLALLLGFACAIGIRNPLRSSAAITQSTNPYRKNSFLLRVHIVSVLLVVPQFTVSVFGLVWLTSQLGWTSFSAGLVVGGAQLAGAVGRIGVGAISDQVGSRMRPLRWVAISAGAVMVLLGLSNVVPSSIAVVIYIVAGIVTVADNGLAFTAVAESAGAFWSGRALGVQNTGQFIAASVVGPGVGALIDVVGYPAAFAITAGFPAVARLLIPDFDHED